MSQSASPESYLSLPIDVPDDRAARYGAKGPEAWANLLVEVALQESQRADLLGRLRVGAVTIGVIFAADNWRAAMRGPLNYAACGDIKADGNSLEVSTGVPKDKMDYGTISFRRFSPDTPYRPVSCQDAYGHSVQFPEDTTGGLPMTIAHTIHWFSVCEENTRAKLGSLDGMFRWVPYVRISEPQ
jgi:hypothetical protein